MNKRNMKKTIMSLISFLLVSAFLSVTVFAQVPQKLNYQGYLADASGIPVTETVAITFAIYDVATGGSALWTETQTVNVLTGKFSVHLGETTPIELEVAKSYYLGLKIGDEAELTPREELTSTMYALFVDGITLDKRVFDTSNISVDNTFVGIGAGENTAPEIEIISSLPFPLCDGISNTFIGKDAGHENTEGSGNTFIGAKAGYKNTQGNDNTFIGVSAGRDSASGWNVFIGAGTGRDSSGSGNVFIGNKAGDDNSGDSNVFIGKHAGGGSSGSGNVFIGNDAGYNESGSNKLYIANSDTDEPLIYGDFYQRYLKFNGIIKDGLTIRGNVLIQDTNGNNLIELGIGLDYAEGFDVADSTTIEPGTVLVIDPKNPGKLAISNSSYDTKVAGIVAGANDLGSGVRLGAGQFDHHVALAGRVYCKVDATYGEVSPGDLLTTSPTPGYAMVVTNYPEAQGSILGKAMEHLEEGQKGQILVLVTLQ